jgi:small subunit ribosomal protein S1
VTSIRDFGAFVDIGGIEGLIPISEVGWSRVDDIREHFSPDQEVTVVIKSLDWEKDRISFSLKETLKDPWDSVTEDFPVGSTHKGKVARLVQFGAFVTLAPGIDGLVHISKLGGGRRINHPREVVEAGQDIDVIIDGIDNEKKRISLAPADYQTPEEKEEIERKEFREFQTGRQEQKKAKEVGSLGELLKKKLAEKGK